MQSRQSVKHAFFFFTLCHFMSRRGRCSKQGSWLEPYGVGRFITKLKKEKKTENASAVWPGRRDYLYSEETRQKGLALAARGALLCPELCTLLQ